MLTLIPVAQSPSELTDGCHKNPPLLQTEADVQSHSASLGRELGLPRSDPGANPTGGGPRFFRVGVIARRFLATRLRGCGSSRSRRRREHFAVFIPPRQTRGKPFIEP